MSHLSWTVEVYDFSCFFWKPHNEPEDEREVCAQSSVKAVLSIEHGAINIKSDWIASSFKSRWLCFHIAFELIAPPPHQGPVILLIQNEACAHDFWRAFYLK